VSGQDKANLNYRLVELRCSNFKALKAVAIRTDQTVVQVAGRNAQGKSSLLDAIAAAIGGKDAFPKEPIRKGQDRAEIFLDFGGLKLTRKIWTKEGGGVNHSVVLEYADGKRPKSPQDVLDTLRGSPIADDPIAFSRLKPKERYDLLKQLVPDFDFEDQAMRRQEMFEDRTIVGRDRDRVRGAVDSIVVPPDAPPAPVDVTELAGQLRAAGDHNATVDKRAEGRAQAAEQIETLRDEADRLMAQGRAKNAEALALELKLKGAEELPAKIDTVAIEAAIANAETANAGARKRAERLSKEAEAKALETKYDGLTAAIKALDEAKTTAIEQAKLPVPELSFGIDDILLDNLPFDQASTARKIRVSTALLMALKPELRVLLVREGSLLDDEARAALEADAQAHDFVVLMETVGAGDGSGIVIEDGQVV
jgi:hypothetical protein